jgi:hypothetical protein
MVAATTQRAQRKNYWIPAFAGMTKDEGEDKWRKSKDKIRNIK